MTAGRKRTRNSCWHKLICSQIELDVAMESAYAAELSLYDGLDDLEVQRCVDYEQGNGCFHAAWALPGADEGIKIVRERQRISHEEDNISLPSWMDQDWFDCNSGF